MHYRDFSLTINKTWQVTAWIKPECYFTEDDVRRFQGYCKDALGQHIGDTGSFIQKKINGDPVTVAYPFIMHYYYKNYTDKAADILKDTESLENFIKNSPAGKKLHNIKAEFLGDITKPEDFDDF